MTELERLKAERKALNARIKELENNVHTYGIAKYDIESYSLKPSKHYIAVYIPKDEYYTNNGRWRTICCGKTKEEALQQVPQIINDLTRLLAEMEEEK